MALVCVTSPVSHPLSSRLQHYLTCLRYPPARFSSIMNILRPPPQSPAPPLLLWRNICQQFSARHTRHDGPGAAIPNIRSPEKIAQLLARPRLAPTAGASQYRGMSQTVLRRLPGSALTAQRRSVLTLYTQRSFHIMLHSLGLCIRVCPECPLVAFVIADLARHHMSHDVR